MLRSHVFTTLLLGAILATPASLGQTTWYVDDDADPNGDGLSWVTPFKYLQDALAVADDSDEIRVAHGTYKPDQSEHGHATPGDREATFQLISWVEIYGGHCGLDPNCSDPNDRDPNIFESVLSGDLAGNDDPNFVNNDENSYHVLYAVGIGVATRLDGFTITGGNANLLTDLEGNGGGMYNYQSSPTLSNCTFSGNWAVGQGAGMYNKHHNPVVSNCTFTGNATPIIQGYGGGMGNSGSNPKVTNCMFVGNSASHGGGMSNLGSNPTVTNCTFSENSTWQWGWGGGMFNQSSNPTLVNCLFSRNEGGNGGGILNLGGSSPRVLNCTFSGNWAVHSGGGVYTISRSLTATNCISWNNTDNDGANMDESAQIADGHSGTSMVTYSCIQGCATFCADPNDHNIGEDPDFVDPNNGDYHLGAGSPCIDAGCNCGVPPDTADLNDDGDTEEPTPLDLDMEDRFLDDPNDPNDTGSGWPPIVDMGAYEFGGTAGQHPCLGDVDNDRDVDLSDLAALIASYDKCEWDGDPRYDPHADFDCDCCVGLSDLAALLAEYGESCQ